ncbi:MAG TPA: carboxypeptidase regulatory-like domain-containing protein, partial [Isosphaeraceae bacterium]
MSQGASGVVLFAGVGSLAVAAAGVAADEPITVLEGEARVAGTDHPAGRVTLRFYERGFTGEAVADSEGHFRWPTPEGMGLRAGADGQPGPSCQVLAQEEGRWSWEISGADLSPPNDFSRLQSLAGAFRPAETRWQARGGRPWLIVTCPPMGEVVVEVRGPDGATAADRPVRVVPAGSQTGFGGRTTVQFTGRTDGAGRLRIRWAEGVARLRVVVPGLGFGSTGLFEVVGGRETRPDLPPLARFARVEGTLDPRLAGPETTITLTSLFHDPRTWDHAQAVCDAGGHFVLEDVVPGAHSLVVDRAGKPVPIGPASIYPAPGGRIDGLTLHPPAPSPPGGPRPDPGMAGGPAPAGDRPEDIPWLEGTVRDEAGRPVAGADVFVHTSYHGGIRMYEDVRTATSDARGHYRIAGPVWEYMETLTVIVRAAGRPPVVAYAPTPSRSGGPPRTLDLTLAPEGGAVRVTVLKDGRPLPGAGVRLVSVGAVGLSDWAYVGRANGPGRAGIEALFQPAGRTGPDGVATFRGLFPGEYEVSAADRPNPAMPGFYRVWPHEPGLAFGVAEGVAVAAGGEVEHALAVHAQPGAVRLQVLRPDGSPATNRAVSFSFGLGDAGTSTSLKLDGQGIGTYDFTAPGLWTVDVRFRDSKLQSFPTNQEPYDQARALLPVSPGLTLDEPVSLRAVRRELGSMRVRLLDREGRPARGTVMIVGSFGLDPSVDHAGTTDPGGEVRFAGLPSGTYELRGAIDGLPPPFEPGPSGTYPDDAAALRGGVAVTGVPVRVETGTEASAELRTQAVGYLRGTIRPPAGHEASEYQIGFDDDRPGFQIPKRGDPQTGQITCGPLPAGMHVVRFFQGAGQAPWTSAGKQEVDVPAGDVARVDLRPVEAPKAPAADRPGVAFLGMGGISVLESTPSGAGGTVRRADGETPAFAARALLFVPDQDQAVASGI